MVRVKMLLRNEVAVISDGVVYLFDLGGRCVSEDAGNLFSYMEGALDLPIISILSTPDSCEIGVVFPDSQSVTRYSTPLDSMTLAGTLQMSRGFIKILRRTGKVGTTRFNQLLFIYPEDYNLNDLLMRVQATKITEG